MRGLTLDGVGLITYRTDLADPTVRAPTDVVVAVRRAGLCGSDLHPYEGREAVRWGVVAGHEIVGEVAATGRDVRSFAVGDRVLAPFTTSCGACGPCARGLTARCVRGQLFGFGPAGDAGAAALPGGQAELVRVPLAESTLVAIPDGLTDDDAVLLTDNLPTAWCAVRRADLAADGTVVVVGLGAVGLCAVAAATRLGAATVVGVDPVDDRRARATRLGAVTATPDDAAAVLAEVVSDEVGAPSVVEAAGSAAAQALAFSLVRPGGALSVIAVQTAATFPFTPVQAYDANVTVRFGRASVRALLPEVVPWAVDGGARSLARVVVSDPRLPLADGPAVYRRFAARAHGMVKTVFAP